jgi:hypothetical protein
MQSNNTNTILLVVILVLIVGFGVWYFTKKPVAQKEAPGIHLDLTGDTGTMKKN